jgi:hypothetical protein
MRGRPKSGFADSSDLRQKDSPKKVKRRKPKLGEKLRRGI